jgi:hypothetical protein
VNCPVCTQSVVAPPQGGPRVCIGCDKAPEECRCRKPLSPESFFGFDQFCLQLHDAEKEAKRRACNLEHGEADEIGRPINPYRALREILLRHARSLRKLEYHVHSYDDQDLCKFCGLDGRA